MKYFLTWLIGCAIIGGSPLARADESPGLFGSPSMIVVSGDSPAEREAQRDLAIWREQRRRKRLGFILGGALVTAASVPIFVGMVRLDAHDCARGAQPCSFDVLAAYITGFLAGGVLSGTALVTIGLLLPADRPDRRSRFAFTVGPRSVRLAVGF